MAARLLYLDHNATTPLDPEVHAEMQSCQHVFGNPSSIHAAGQQARRIVDLARARVARLIGAQPDEILFTSGGTEANNLAILGSRAAFKGAPRPRIITSLVEHQAVLNPCRHLEAAGDPVAFLPVDESCVIRWGELDAVVADGDDVALVSVMLANNDVGTVEPVAEIARTMKPLGAVIHTDAVQAAGKIRVDVRELGVDLLSLSAHKLHGPKGIGALYVRRGTPLGPLCYGGHQERGLRPGTENVPAIAGFGKACELAAQRLDGDAARLCTWRTRFEDEVLRRVPEASVVAASGPRLPNTSSVSFGGLDGELLVINLDLLGVAVSLGAACASADREPSHVLLAMGRSAEQARSTIRVSFGRTNTDDDVPRAVDALAEAVELLRRRGT